MKLLAPLALLGLPLALGASIGERPSSSLRDRSDAARVFDVAGPLLHSRALLMPAMADPLSFFTKGNKTVGGAAINAPLDGNEDDYIGYRNAKEQGDCAAECLAQTSWALKHLNGAGNAKTCGFFVAFQLSKNNETEGLYCALYTKTIDLKKYSTNVGQWRDKDYFKVSGGVAFTLGDAIPYNLKGGPKSGCSYYGPGLKNDDTFDLGSGKYAEAKDGYKAGLAFCQSIADTQDYAYGFFFYLVKGTAWCKVYSQPFDGTKEKCGPDEKDVVAAQWWGKPGK